MTEQQLRDLNRGDVITHSLYPNAQFIVTGNYGNRATAVMTVDVTNPGEWDVKMFVEGYTVKTKLPG